MEFRKSTESGPWTDNCVEVGAESWKKSSFSTNSAQCVETAFTGDGTIHIRDTKNPGGPCLHFTVGEWDAFIGGVKNGEFDLG